MISWSHPSKREVVVLVQNLQRFLRTDKQNSAIRELSFVIIGNAFICAFVWKLILLQMLFRQVAGKVLVPGLEKDLSKAISKELASAHKMTDCLLAPTVHAFQESSGGAFGQTIQAASPVRMVKVEYEIPGRGLFR